MSNLLLAVCGMLLLSMPTADLAFMFGAGPTSTNDWVSISDNVMGGVTRSKLSYTDTSMVLAGTISLENYGGFASVKTRFGAFDLSKYSGVRIRYRATNQTYAITLEDSRNWTQPNYKGALMPASSNTWHVQTISFRDFKEYQIGEPTGNSLDPSSLSRIVRLGIITTEKKAGPFSLEVAEIVFVR